MCLLYVLVREWNLLYVCDMSVNYIIQLLVGEFTFFVNISQQPKSTQVDDHFNQNYSTIEL